MARPRADDYGEKQQLIRDRAAELFATRGFAGTSTADIARACGFSKALFYHYFASKEQVLYDLLIAYVTALLAAAEAALAESADPRAQFRAVVRAHLRLYATARARHILLLNELDALPAAEKAEIVGLERRLVRLVADLIGRLAPPIRERRELRVPTAMAFYGMINWTYTWYRPNGRLTPESFADLAVDLFLDGIGAAAARR
ncbi:MAG: TetR/AcrR family transcriptional regulator [Rhodospirillales bacterium]|nr:TetR/AcrR family transcriptional regulator [Rhodospirillales bacterium]